MKDPDRGFAHKVNADAKLHTLFSDILRDTTPNLE